MAKHESLRIMSNEEFHKRHIEEKVEMYKKHQTASPKWSEIPFSQRKDYEPIEWNGQTYLQRQFASHLTETILLDEKGRKVEYWRNWDNATQRIKKSYTYDHEGFLISTTEVQGNGYGDSITVEYVTDTEGTYIYDEEGKRIPKQAIYQHYLGDPSRYAFSYRVLGPGRKDGEPLVIDLLDAVQ